MCTLCIRDYIILDHITLAHITFGPTKGGKKKTWKFIVFIKLSQVGLQPTRIIVSPCLPRSRSVLFLSLATCLPHHACLTSFFKYSLSFPSSSIAPSVIKILFDSISASHISNYPCIQKNNPHPTAPQDTLIHIHTQKNPHDSKGPIKKIAFHPGLQKTIKYMKSWLPFMSIYNVFSQYSQSDNTTLFPKTLYWLPVSI